MSYKSIFLNDDFELNLWITLLLENPKSIEVGDSWFFDVYVKFKKGVIRNNLKLRQWVLKNSKTTFVQIELVRGSLEKLSDHDLKHLKALIELREENRSFEVGLFRSLLGLLKNLFSFFLLFLSFILTYESVKGIVEEWLTVKALENTGKVLFVLLIFLSTLNIYVFLFKELYKVFIKHESKKKEVKRYLLFLIEDILEERSL